MGVKVLVVVDMQNDFIDGALGTEEAPYIISNVKDKIKKYYDDEAGVIYGTMDAHNGNDYNMTEEGRNLPIPHCIVGTKGFLMHPEIEKIFEPYRKYNEFIEQPKMAIFSKETFGSGMLFDKLAELEIFLKNHAEYIESIELVGLCTDICVISNAVIAKAACPNAHIIVDARCCAGVTDESHDRALESMKTLHIQVVGQGEEPWRNKKC